MLLLFDIDTLYKWNQRQKFVTFTAVPGSHSSVAQETNLLLWQANEQLRKAG